MRLALSHLDTVDKQRQIPTDVPVRCQPSIRPSQVLMTSLLRTTRLYRAHVHFRSLATPSSSTTNNFSQTLADGPSLDEFVSGEVPDRIVLGNIRG